MTTGAFMDRAYQPTGDEVLGVLGDSRPRWEALTAFLAEAYHVSGELLYAGKKDGWAVRYKKGGKSLLWMYPQRGGFRALVVLGAEAAETALGTSVSDKTRKAIESAHAYHDGRWVCMSVESEQDAADVRQMLLAKAKPARK